MEIDQPSNNNNNNNDELQRRNDFYYSFVWMCAVFGRIQIKHGIQIDMFISLLWKR